MPLSKEKEEELLLQREAAMSSMSLGVGLTHLRKYDFVKPEYFYSSLFSITIGLERLMKLIVIYDHRIKNNGQFPNNKLLKHEYGHKLNDLFSRSININNESNFDIDISHFNDDALYKTIIEILSDFASESRYYNLDGLTGKAQNKLEPLHRWNNEVNSVILSRHYKPKKSTIKKIKNIARQKEDNCQVMFTDENGGDIRSLEHFYLEGNKVPVKQKYSMYYIYVISRFLADLLGSLEAKGQFYPFLRESFVIFQCDSKPYILRRKTWNPREI